MKRYTNIIGSTLVGLSLVTLAWGGWYIILCMIGSFVPLLLGGNAHIEELLSTAYGMEIILVLVTGLSFLTRSKATFPLTVATFLFTYIVGGIWLAVGTWPVDKLLNAGSAQPTLEMGNRLLVDGDFHDTVIDPTMWLVKMLIMTIVWVFFSILITRFFRRDDVRILMGN